MNVIERASAIIKARAVMSPGPLALHEHKEPLGCEDCGEVDCTSHPSKDRGEVVWYEVHGGPPPAKPDDTPEHMVASFCEMSDQGRDQANAAGFVVLHAHAADVARALLELRDAATDVLIGMGGDELARVRLAAVLRKLVPAN